MKVSGKHFAVLILAAGYSGRMGMPKAFLPYDANRTFLEKIVSEYLTFGCTPVSVVLNKQGMELYEKLPLQQKENIIAILNPAPEKERFFSVQTGLKALNFKGSVFLHNVDNPFLTRDILEALASASKENIYVVPTYHEDGGHPILLSQEIVKALIETSDYEQNLRVFLESYDQIHVSVNDPNILTNINSKEEYEKFFRKLPHKSL
jgi:molybdenum cofactor cytidylyltransferase